MILSWLLVEPMDRALIWRLLHAEEAERGHNDEIREYTFFGDYAARYDDATALESRQ